MTGLLIETVVETAWSVALAVAPLAAFFAIFQVVFLGLPRREISRIVFGTLLASAGLFLFLLGVGVGFLPFGRVMGEALGALQHTWLLVPIGLLLGFVTTWGEPAVRILADQVEHASAGSIHKGLVLNAICVGVAVSVAVGMLRIVYEIPLIYVVVPGYAIVLAIMWFSEKSFVSIAIDAGGVATGPMANTFLLALAFGVSASIDGQDPLIHGLGMVSLIALAPVISVMIVGLVVRRLLPGRES